jgi:AAA domain, putative AbiEii toxin, Type IV TA system/AAA domain
MRVTRLKLTNLRAIESAEFRFQPGFNLIIGVNGVGKTSVLDSLGVCLSAIVRHTNRLRAKAGAFLVEDIRKDAQALTAECVVQIGNDSYAFLVHKSRSPGEGQAAKTGMPREQVLDTPDRAEFVGAAPKAVATAPHGGRPFGVLFSTRRAVVSNTRPSKGSASGDIAGACADAFVHRELRLAEFASWMRAQQAQENERSEARLVLEAFEGVTRRFLPGYRNIRTTDEAEPRLLIDRGERTTIRVDELSDSERARLEEALEWVDNWMALNWSPDPKLTETELRGAHADQKASILEDALARFLPNCENLRRDGTVGVQVIDRSPTTIEVAQLSDGERGTLALVLDLTRRLAQANPKMADPAAEAEAVVLIDEIDLHLHPKWQRQIVHNLTAAFPRCQFITTSHSPQVIGEVEHDRIQIIANGQVYSPPRSFGLDSSRVLEEVMDADPRAQEVKAVLSQLSQEVGRQRFESARGLLVELVDRLGEDDAEVARARTLLDFMEGEE